MVERLDLGHLAGLPKPVRMLRVHLLGRPRLFFDDTPVPLAARPKVVPLLAYLLVHRAHAVPRSTAANALWPDEPEETARANLRRHVSYLHALLPAPPDAPPWIASDSGAMQWNPRAEFWLDIAEFERLAATPHRLADAAALYAGDLLGDIDEAALEAERERLRTIAHRTLSALVAERRAARDYDAAIAAAQRLLADDPWREDTVRALMHAHYERGDRAGAMAVYESFARSLRAELATAPMAETVAVYETILHDAVAVSSGGANSEPAPRAPPAGLPFVGRPDELAILRRHADAAANGRGGVVLVAGEAGIGKTRLVHEFGTACESRGMDVFTGSVSAPEPIPYQPFVQMLGAAAPLLRTTALDPLWVSAVAAIVPAMAAIFPGLPALAPAEPGRERARLFEACANVWEAIGTRRPAVLVLEDLHHAGPGTLALLEYLARTAAQRRVLIVATYRVDDADAGGALRALRRTLEASADVAHLALPPLSRTAVDELLRTIAGGAQTETLATLLHARAEGSPFFLVELVRELREGGRLRVVDGSWSFDEPLDEAIPAAVRDVIALRLTRLSEPSALLAQTAAVIGDAFDVEMLCGVTGWFEPDVLDALGELIDRRMVSERGTRRAFEYAFTHQVIEAVVYDAIDVATRARRHRRTAQVLAGMPAGTDESSAATLARHWELGGEPERAAERYLAAARHALDVYGNEEAGGYAARVVALTRTPRLRFEALLLRERVAATRGERDAQARDLEEAGRVARELHDGEGIGIVLERRIELANVIGDRRRERVLLGLLERHARRAGGIRWRIRALESAARYRRAVNDFAGVRTACTELITLSTSIGDRDAHAAARLALADTFIYEGRLPEAYGALDELRSAVHDAGDRGALIRTLIGFSRAALAQQDYRAMSEFAAEAHDVSRRIGDREGEALALHTMANGLLYTDRVDDAASYYERAQQIYERIGHRVGLASIFVDRGLFMTELGLLDEALRWYDRARRAVREIGFGFVACVEQIDRSYCRRLRGEPLAARAAARTARALARRIGARHLESAALGTLGTAETLLDDCGAAVAHLTRAVDLRRRDGATPRLGDNLCALAFAQARAGDLPAACRAADEMLALHEAHPHLAPQPTEWLWTAVHVAHVSGRDDDASRLLGQAADAMAARAAAIGEPATRAAYLALPFNRAIRDALAVRA